jgi:C1A family cysteine protease
MAQFEGQGRQGWFEEPLDDRDKMYVAPDGLVVAQHVNLWTQYPQSRVRPYNQGHTNTCVVNAAAAALWYDMNVTHPPQPEGPSRLFIYWNARVSELSKDTQNIPNDDGCYCRRVMRSLEKVGACIERLWPFAPDRTQLELSAEAYASAQDYKIDTYWRLDPARPVEDLHPLQKVEDGRETLLKVRQCLSEGFPIVFGFKLYSLVIQWRRDADNTWILPDLWAEGTVLPHQKPGNFGGHAVLMIGYDDKKAVVLCQNSWGDSSSRAGSPIFYIPYSWIEDYEATSDFWSLRGHVRR